jgi:hypothetical protein
MLACSLSHQYGSPRSSATRRASSTTTPWGTKVAVNVASHAGGVVGQGHGGTADDEHIGDDTPAGQALA